MTPRAVGVILGLLALLCLATWLFAEDPGMSREIATPTPSLPVKLEDSHTAQEVERVEAKIDSIIELAEQVRAYLREQQEKRGKVTPAPKSVTIINNRIVLPTPAPTAATPTPTARPDPTPKHGGLLEMFRRQGGSP